MDGQSLTTAAGQPLTAKHVAVKRRDNNNIGRERADVLNGSPSTENETKLSSIL